MNRIGPIATLVLLAAVVRADDKGTVVELDGLKSKAPAAWKPQEPTMRERVYQFDLPKADGDKHESILIIFHFGAGQGGGTQANVERWKGMIVPADGAKPDESFKLNTLKVGETKVTIFEANGTYKFKRRPFDPNEEPELRPNFRLVGVIMETPNGPYYMRMVGPQKSLEAQRAAFEEWLKNFK